jgi:hypothetical protein
LINNRQGGRRRGRGGGGGGGPPRSNNPGPGNRQDNRQRGNAAQLLEKYKSLARDAQMGGDRVQTEYYLQYADHYFRVLNESRVRYEEQRRPRDDYGDEGDEQAGESSREAIEPAGADEPATREEVYRERPRQEARDDNNESSESEERDEHNGEFRRGRGRARRDEIEDDDGEERIALDVLPPAISPVSEPEAEEAAPARAPRARRPRRPRADDEDVAPAA